MDGDGRHPTTREECERIVGKDVDTHDGTFVGRVDRIVYPEPGELAAAELGHVVVVRPIDPSSPLGRNALLVPETAVALANQDAVELAVDANRLGEQRWALHF